MNTGILVHGCHVQAKNWKNIVWGHPPYKMGRVPTAVWLALQYGSELKKIVFGSGASERDGKLESEITLDLLKERWDSLMQFTSIHELGNLPTRDDFLKLCVIETTSQNTFQEVTAAGHIFLEADVQSIILVSSPTHIMRCHQNALLAFKKDETLRHLKHGLFTHASDVPYADSSVGDVVIFEPPHRGDRTHTNLHKILPGIFKIPADNQQCFCDELSNLIEAHQNM